MHHSRGPACHQTHMLCCVGCIGSVTSLSNGSSLMARGYHPHMVGSARQLAPCSKPRAAWQVAASCIVQAAGSSCADSVSSWRARRCCHRQQRPSQRCRTMVQARSTDRARHNRGSQPSHTAQQRRLRPSVSEGVAQCRARPPNLFPQTRNTSANSAAEHRPSSALHTSRHRHCTKPAHDSYGYSDTKVSPQHLYRQYLDSISAAPLEYL